MLAYFSTEECRRLFSKGLRNETNRGRDKKSACFKLIFNKIPQKGIRIILMDKKGQKAIVA